MVAPVSPMKTYLNTYRTGLISPDDVDFRINRSGQTQRRPYNLSLTASAVYNKYTHYWRSTPEKWIFTPSMWDGLSYSEMEPYATQAYNKAYERFKDAMLNGDGADMGTNLAERRQAMEMVGNRLTQLARFTRKLKRFDFVGAGSELGLTKGSTPKGLKPKAKALGNNWLEYHFGWSPLVKDVGGAIATLQSGIPPTRVRASATVNGVYKSTRLGRPYNITTIDYHAKVKISAEVSVTNPNLWLANQLGLINPAALAWELVPFSFVVDWFGNVGNYLSSYTDFAGVTISNPSTTMFHRVRADVQEGYTDLNWLHAYKFEKLRMERSPAPIAGPTLQFNLPRGLSPTRGLTAVSLILQMMR